jgi:hypothetical protein
MISITQRIPHIRLAVLALACVCPGARGEDGKLSFGAASWMQYGQIAKSADTSFGREPNGKGMLGTGAQFLLRYHANEWLQVNAGLGVGAGHFVAANRENGFYAPMGVGPYVAEANATFGLIDRDESKLFIRTGLFPYDYAPEAQNLGLYLLRGPVYPGLLTSGFETKYVLPVANTLGFQFHHQAGSFEHDLLFTFDSDWFPYWDISPAYVAAYHFGKAARIGGGAQFYHYIPIDRKLTSQKTDWVRYIDTTVHPAPETTFISFKGIKVMGNFEFDPKALMGYEEGSGSLGPEDLKIYGEAAILGLDGDKAHNALYGTLAKRMPMMIGFNLPAFKFVDRLNVEVEYYGAPWVDDPSIYNHTTGNQPTPIPRLSAADTNTTKDNIKWSIYASKVVSGHVKISAQAASDHFRPGFFTGYGDNAPPSNEVPFFSPKEWYWTGKIAYFF